MVERRLKEALKNDRARIQVGHISHFGLMEMSRQRLRPSLAETSFIACPHCGGMGHVRSTESAAIHVLRGIEEEGAKRRAAEIVVYAAPPVALYILNHKRERLGEIEQRYGMRVVCLGDDGQMTSQFRIERMRAQVVSEAPVAITQESRCRPRIESEEEVVGVEAEEDEDETETEAEDAVHAEAGETAEEAERRRHRRRRRRRGGRREDAAPAPAAEGASPARRYPTRRSRPRCMSKACRRAPRPPEDETGARRRGRRGGRRRRHDGNGEMPPHAAPGADQPDLPPVYSGPTPANPFGGQTFDIFDVLEQAEAATPVFAAAAPEVERADPVILVDPEMATHDEPTHDEPTHEEPGPVLVEPEPVQVEPPRAEPEPVAAEPEPEPAPAANDAAQAPVIQPIVIGGEQDVVVEKKRGWWRR